MALIGSLGAIRRYPVKSMRGEEFAAAVIGERGLAHDRAWAVIDRETGLVASAKLPRLWGGLLACEARVLDQPGGAGEPPVEIRLPDGAILTAGDGELDVALSRAFGRAVTLATVPPPGAAIARYWPDLAALPLRDTETTGPIGLGAPPGTFFDYAPVHLLTTAALAHLRAVAPGVDWDARRFRPNLVLATDGPPGLVENAWVGRALLIGDAVRLRITTPSPRCVVPTLPQGALPRDPAVLRAVAAHNRPALPALGGATLPSLGVYAVVERGGVVRRGDPLRLDG